MPVSQHLLYFSGSQLPVDQNGYEYLPPDRVGFGDPLPPRPIKTTSAYATPTSLQIQPIQSAPQSQAVGSQNFYTQTVTDIYSAFR